MERYARHVIYKRWLGDSTYRPYISVDTLAEAVEIVDAAKHESVYEYKVIDLEHLDLGDMLVAEECAILVADIRGRVTA